MKNLLILIVFAAVFLHFYPQPEVTKFYEEQKAYVLSLFSDATDTRVRLKADKIYTDLEPKFDSFRPSEIKRLKEITSDRTNVKQYYSEFCSNKRDTKFHVANQELICKTITKYSSML
jgi:hypothetical protein